MNKKAVGKKAEPTGEELEFIYSKFQEKLSDKEVLEEMQDQPFPLRSLGFLKRRRKEFNAAKYVLKEYIEYSNDLVVLEARKKHYEELLELIKEWKSQLVVDAFGAVTRYEINFPPTFTRKDIPGPGHYWKGSLHWLVGQDGTVEVLFKAEQDVLFESLKVHLPSKQLWNSFNELKRQISEAIEKASSIEENKSVPIKSPFPLVNQIVDELDKALAKRIFPSKCEICRDYRS